MNEIERIEKMGSSDLVGLFEKIEKTKSKNPVATESREEKIKRLHLETASYVTIALWKAVEIGQLLTEQKAELKHGEFMPWIKANMPFSTATARNYMTLWERREDLKLLNVSNLKTAYKIVKETLPTMHLEYSPTSVFSSVKHPEPFSHCDDDQKRKWLAKWILDSPFFDHPMIAWGNMEWWATRFTFDEYYDPTRAPAFGVPALKARPRKICDEVKKDVNEFLEEYKAVDLLKLKFTCLNIYELPDEATA